MSAPYDYIEFDVATGVSRALRSTKGSIAVSRDGTEITVNNAYREDVSGVSSFEEIIIMNRDGLTTDRVLVREGIGGVSLISPDKKHIMLEWQSIDLGDAGGVRVITVFDRSGAIVKRFTNYGSYQWMPDGRILLTRGSGIYVSTLTGSPTLIKTIANESPAALRVSPDGNKVAFTIGDSVISSNHTWIMNIDGSGLRQVSTSFSNDQPEEFSPDGNTLLVSQGINYATVGPGYAFAGCAELYAVSLAISGVANITAAVRPAGVVKLRSVDTDDGAVKEKTCGFSNISWRVLPELPVAVAGSTPSGAGLNKGLTGTAIYGFAGDVYKSDISSGATTKIIGISNAPGVSFDGSEIVLTDRFAAGTNVNQAAVTFHTASGVQTSRINVLEGFDGRVKPGPNKNLLAAAWHNLDAGDPGGANFINIFDRTKTERVYGGNLFVKIARFTTIPGLRDTQPPVFQILIARASRLDSRRSP